MMSNQGDTFGGPLDINQLQWALRHGQKIDGLESIVQSNQPVTVSDNRVNNRVDHNRVLEEQIDQLGQSLNREIVSLKGEFAIVAQGVGLEEKIDKLEQSLKQEIVSLKSEFAIVAQGAFVEEQIDQLGRSMNQEILSLKSEIGIVARGTAVEEQIDKLGQTLNQEILSLKGELAIVAQDKVVEEQIDQLGQSLNQEILSLKSEIANVAQDTTIEEKVDQLGQSLNQEILSLKNEIEIIFQGAIFEEQIKKIEKYINQEILPLKSEFAVFGQTQLNQEKVWKIAEFEWKNSLTDCETKLQADMREMQHNIMENFDEHFQYLDAQLQNNDNMLRQEAALLTSQLEKFQQAQSSREETLGTCWQKKLEERQTRLIEDVDYMQFVLEEIATRPQGNEAQQKIREKFFIHEISALKEEIASLRQKWNAIGNEFVMTDVEQYKKSLAQQGINLDNDDQMKIYKKKRKRRH